MKAALNGHVEKQRHVMFQRSADEVRNLLKQMVKTLQETLDEKADEIFLAMRRDYRSVLGGGDLPHGELLPKAQRLMRKEVMGKIGKAEKIFKKVAGLEVEEDEKGEEEEIDPSGKTDVVDQPGLSGQESGTLETQYPAAEDEPMTNAPIATTKIKGEAAERAKPEPTSNSTPIAPDLMDAAFIECSKNKQSTDLTAAISSIDPSSVAQKENDDHTDRKSSHELTSGPSLEGSEESEGSWAADEDSE